ncbi:HD domain-containing protein [Sphingomonas sp. NFR15]|uniref:HD domain-containing protein n=1 Tax=Sphingomonas sp. NFR15 TaxID=1566282 RepID=UPI00088FDB95|nr:HD domain-containing protein [Sphingomonas sp. NFR15]SDA31623.1 phosphonate degradation operons associated HDIG domain protein [Sphingomonas sp. NFR15]
MTTQVIDEIYALFAAAGDEYYGENATQLQHALQVAELVRRAGGDAALIAAGLLHDVGQLIDDAGHAAERHGTDMRHEMLGNALLKAHFPPALTEPVRLHVDAKRYLCAVEPGYQASLSAASLLSLRLQGGALDAEGRAAFEAEPYFAEALLLRRCDDGGKRKDWVVPTLESYRPLLEALVVSRP